MVKKLETVLKAKIGETVTVPINVTGGGRRKRAASPGCKRMECPSGFSRIGNSQRCQKPFGSRKPNCAVYGPSASVFSFPLGSSGKHIYYCHADMIPAAG